MNLPNCPVPKDQQPTNEFIELSKSKIFSLPKSKKSFSLILIKYWVGTFIIFLAISVSYTHLTLPTNREV